MVDTDKARSLSSIRGIRWRWTLGLFERVRDLQLRHSLWHPTATRGHSIPSARGRIRQPVSPAKRGNCVCTYCYIPPLTGLVFRCNPEDRRVAVSAAISQPKTPKQVRGELTGVRSSASFLATVSRLRSPCCLSSLRSCRSRFPVETRSEFSVGCGISGVCLCIRICGQHRSSKTQFDMVARHPRYCGVLCGMYCFALFADEVFGASPAAWLRRRPVSAN